MPSIDTLKTYATAAADPIVGAGAVVPNDAADLPVTTRAVYLGAAGDLRVTLRDTATPVTFTGMAAGWHPVRVVRVWATGTTATDIVGCW